MVQYNSKDNVKSGLPLGGIGAGKFEILPYGTIDYITYQNNWSKPIFNSRNKDAKRAYGVLGFSFGVYCESKGKKWAGLLQTEKIKGIPSVENIKFEGSFPFAYLEYRGKDLPLKVNLEAFSPFIPGNIKDSSIPGSVFTFKIKNTTSRPASASVLFIGRNLIGQDPIGRYNQVIKDKRLTSLVCKTRNPLSTDFTSGETCFSIENSNADVTYYSGWNMQTKNFKFSSKDICLDAWRYFKKDGCLPDIDNKIEIQGGSFELGGALAAKVSLKPRQTKEINFYYTWHFPRHDSGHIYEKRFDSARSVAFYLNKNRKSLENRTRSWQEKIKKLAIPGWLKDALINNLYILFSSTWLTKDRKFAMYEAPVICPLMGTLDVSFYGSVALGLLFPELDKNALEQFKKAQRKNGYIPHDLGSSRLDMPSDGTTFYQWKDLNPKFVLLVYRDYLWTKDLKFLKSMYPCLKKALEFSFSTDKNKDFLPDNEGADQTFDCWYFHGTNSYTSGIFLAALKAAEKIAVILKDKAFAEKCAIWFDKGLESFQKKLWNGKYFIASLNTVGRYESCILGQLTGQWYAHMLGLGYILPKDKVKKAVRTMLDLNTKISKFGAVNSVLPNGKLDKTSLHSGTIWPGVCYAFSALAIYEGFADEGLAVAKKTWENFALNNKNPWNQPDLIFPSDGRFGFGDYYMRNAVIWSVLLALAGKDKKLKKLTRDVVARNRGALPL